MNELIKVGIEKGYISIDENQMIEYIGKNKRKRNFLNPEEKVQAETYVKLIHTYSYPANRIKVYETIAMGSTQKEVDIIVYDDEELTKPLLIVECKKEEVSDLEFKQAVEQAASYAYAVSGTIKYIWITSNILNEYYLVDKDSNIKQTKPDIPRFGVKKIQEYKYAKGGKKGDEDTSSDVVKQNFFDLETIDESELTKRFKQAHNALWAGGELNPSEAFDELDKLIFCKIWDERKAREIGKPYDFQIFSKALPVNASKDVINKIEKQMSVELFDRINKLYEEGKRRDPEVFRDNIRLNHIKVKTVVSYLESVNLTLTDLDSKGKAFETFMGSYFRGDFGQYFTPRPIVKMIVNSLPITNESKVLDTSCGSGGFLLYALDKVRKNADKFFTDGTVEHYRYWHDFAEKNLYGIEINEQISRTAKMNMIIHDDGHTNVITADGLLDVSVIKDRTRNDGFDHDSFDYIITNPPFGSIVKQTEKAYLHNYRLGNKEINWLDLKKTVGAKRTNQSTEVLFIEQCWRFLKPGGFLAIVIPDGILTNSSLQYVRDNIEEWFRIVAIISLPNTAFSHTGAGVKSSILYLRKWDKSTSDRIDASRGSIQNELKEKYKYQESVNGLLKEKKDILKTHSGFDNTTSETLKKRIEKTQEFMTWKKSVNEEYNNRIKYIQENMNDEYIVKRKAVLDYKIYMSMVEDVGYDAKGKPTLINELDQVEEDLGRFIKQLCKEDSI